MTPWYDHGMIKSSKRNPEEETKMMRRLMSKLFGKKEVTGASGTRVEKAMATQATVIAKALAQLDALAGKAGN